MSSRIYRMRTAVYCCAGGLFCLSAIPHAFPSLGIKSVSWSEHDPPEQLVDHVHKIARYMGLPHSKRITVFLTKGLSSLTVGSTWLPNGAAIGLPRSVLFQSREDIRNSLLESAGSPVDWDSEFGTELERALTPSGQQINFVIAHEVAHLKHNDWLPRVVLPPLTLVLVYHIARIIPQYVAQRHSLASFVLAMGTGLALHLQLVAYLSQQQEYRADKNAAQCSTAYAEGGLDHFTKRMKLDSVLESKRKPTKLERFKPSFSLHPPPKERFDKIQNLIANSKIL